MFCYIRWEKYDAKGWTEKGAHKYGRLNEQSWWEKWGEHYDGRGSVLKWYSFWPIMKVNSSIFSLYLYLFLFLGLINGLKLNLERNGETNGRRNFLRVSALVKEKHGMYHLLVNVRLILIYLFFFNLKKKELIKIA